MWPNAEQIYIKRDDLSAADYGGNKIRKLDFLLADALARGRRELTVFGYAGSNFVAASAWHGSQLGLRGSPGLLQHRSAAYIVDNLSISLPFGPHLFLHNRDSAMMAHATSRLNYTNHIRLVTNA